METNTLVLHKKNIWLGIGCVSKVLKNTVKVNWGLDDCKACSPSMLNVIDTSHCKNITFHEFRSRILSDKSTLNDCIVGNELKHYVGIGWTTTRVVTYEDLKKYPRVIE